MKRFVLAIGFIAIITPVGAAPPPPAAGEETGALYNKKCSMCHGKNGVAKKMAEGSADLNDPEWQKSTSTDEIVRRITDGEGKMPGYQDKLSEAEIKAIAEYVRTLK